jgi:uncharacterized protein
LFRTIAAAVAGTMVIGAAIAEEPDLPRSMVWSAYDLGSSGYAEATGIANALKQNYDTRIRIVPAGTSIGRILPMVTGKVTYGFLANEAYFASEGTFDFATEQWGPQNLRIVLGRLASNGLATAGDISVESVADLKGKRVGFVKGNPSVNVKTDAYLAFAGLTRNDVEPVWYGSYNAMKTAVLSNQLDAYSSVTTSANMREIEASPRGLVWPEFPPDDKAGWDRMNEVVSFLSPYKETAGAGISEEKPLDLIGYRYPMITVYQDAVSDDEVYNLIKAVDLSFDDFKNTTSSSANWAVEIAGRPPYDAPAHEGTIRYLKEKDLWREEDQAWQEKRMARLEKVMALWSEAQAEFTDWRAAEQEKGNKVDAEAAWLEYWEKKRAENL